jgi:hypothetical protein
MSFQDVPFGGYAEDRTPVHMDKVWNDTDVPYSSFIVEIKYTQYRRLPIPAAACVCA